jgi:catechol 2,3-dioxygenase-like lactoylglutathione lyase family enzyme
MINRVTHASIYVRDIDEALRWYTEKLGFIKHSDDPMGENDRWVTITAPNQPDFELILQPPHWGTGGADTEERASLLGKLPGFVMETEDIVGQVARLEASGVKFTMPVTDYPWAKQAVFEDLYGTSHVLSQPPSRS